MKTKKVAVIGGGPCGLITLKCLKEENIEPVCFERTSHYGGLWRYHDEDIEGLASVMKSTTFNTSKEMTTLSDFPPPEDCPNYLHHSDFYKNMTEYAKIFDLLRHINYNQEVIKIELNEDYNESGRLKVIIKDTKTEAISEYIFDGVTVCVGHHVYPKMPCFSGQETFKGTIIHTHSLKTTEMFKDKVVVVVGAGSSAMDAAVESSYLSKQVYLSTRRGAWIMPRVGLLGAPFDIYFTTQFINLLMSYVPFRVSNYVIETYLNLIFDHSKYNIKPKHRFFSQHPAVSDTLPLKILSGRVKVKPNIKEIQENGVIFEDENVVTPVDVLIFATGYLTKFPFIDKKITTLHDNEVHLYKYMYPPNLVHHTFAIIGLAQIVGGGGPLAEAQARLFCQVFNSKTKLPSIKDMINDIKCKKTELRKRYISSTRHTFQEDYVKHLNELYSIIKAKPNFWKMLFTDPKLFIILFFGPSLPYQYRLQGPHPWPKARETILNYEKRIYRSLNKDYEPKNEFQTVLLGLALIAGFLVVLSTIIVYFFYNLVSEK